MLQGVSFRLIVQNSDGKDKKRDQKVSRKLDEIFTVFNFTPEDTFMDIKKFSKHRQIAYANAFQFYYKGIPLPHNQKLSKFLTMLKKDEEIPILIYAGQYQLNELNSTQLLLHFSISYLPSTPKEYQLIVEQTIPYEREKLRRLKETWQLSIRQAQNGKKTAWKFFIKDYMDYIKRLLVLEKNGHNIKHFENLEIKSRCWESQTLESSLLYKIEGVE